MAGWAVERLVGRASALHGRVTPPVGTLPLVTVLDVTTPAVVLGSNQPSEVLVDLAGSGIDVARRRGGGGAVWLAPGQQVWLDVDVPRDHPRWDDDVTRSSWWLGAAIAAVVDGAGVGPVTVERHMRPSRWSPLVCFAGAGPGEVYVGDRKVWGWSQRRTRDGARFMGVGYLEWDAVPLLDVLRLDAAERAAAARDLATAGAGLSRWGLTADGFVADLVRAMGAAPYGGRRPRGAAPYGGRRPRGAAPYGGRRPRSAALGDGG